MSRRFDLVAFDVDGTLIHHPKDKTIWEVLNLRFTGSDDQNAERWEQYRRGTLSYADWVALDIEGWRAAGATRETLLSDLDGLTLVDGARETLSELKAGGARLAVISGSFPFRTQMEIYRAALRKNSLNEQLAELAAQAAADNGATVQRASMSEFDCPSYDGDVEREEGIPKGAQEFSRRLTENDAFMISSPS